MPLPHVALLPVFAALALIGAAPREDDPAEERFIVSEVMIPMRDGVRLHAKMFRPRDQKGDLPFLLSRTPYGVAGSDRHFTSYMKALADEGYIFVFQDIRGKFGSEGTFVMQRPPRAEGDTTTLDEGTDTYDSIAWLLSNVPQNNGRVGMLGISYDGWTTIMGALEPHPALRAISPQASPADMWLGDDFHHNGAFRWRRWDAWPPKAQTEERSLYFGADRKLSFERPAEENEASDMFVSDPAHPVPYRQRPIQPTYAEGGSRWPAWLVEDQRFVDRRADVLSWETPPLEDDLTIAGEVVADLFASTTGTDADWVVKLIDVYPEKNPEDWELAGYQLMVSNEVFRGRYRKGFERPEPIPAGEAVAYSFSLHTQNYTFRKGHRVMVQVQSTWFPLIDRNPQTFVPNIFEAKDTDFRASEHRIHRSAKRPSRVAIPVVVRPAS